MRCALLLMSLAAVSVLSGGCQHTREAYALAESPDEYAYVMAEHYSDLVKQAADLKEQSSTPSAAVAWMQRAEVKTTPAVRKMRELRDAYVQVKDASTERELQEAIDRAVLLIADMIRAVQSARGQPTSSLDPVSDRILASKTKLRSRATHHFKEAA